MTEARPDTRTRPAVEVSTAINAGIFGLVALLLSIASMTGWSRLMSWSGLFFGLGAFGLLYAGFTVERFARENRLMTDGD